MHLTTQLDEASHVCGNQPQLSDRPIPVRVTYKDPDADDVLPPPEVMVLAPASCNTINKLAAGISDTLALGLLNEALGAGLPIVAAPWAKDALRNHPAYPRSIAILRDAGVALVEASGYAGEVFPWQEVLLGVAEATATLSAES